MRACIRVLTRGPLEFLYTYYKGAEENIGELHTRELNAKVGYFFIRFGIRFWQS